ncbi:MAG: aminopeptidase [Patescibacteria group bacterium]|nr:aminopeptidase [Patescibacteria group bacterium]
MTKIEQPAKFEQLAQAFADQEFNPAENEQHEKLRQVARNILDCFDWQPSKEDFLLITDTKVMRDNPIMIKALEHELKQQLDEAQQQHKKTGRFQTRVVEASPKSAAPLGESIGEAMRNKPVLILTSMSRSHSRETGTALRGAPETSKKDYETLLSSDDLSELANSLTDESGEINEEAWLKLKQLAKKRRSRMISITKGHNPYNILTEGAALEKTGILRERADNVKQLMRDVEKVHITTPIGTDLWLKVRPDLEEIEDGRVNKPGAAANYPIGEWSCSPDWEGSSGVLVVDGPCGGNINQHILDKGKPLKLDIKDGQIINSTGGAEALEMWRSYLNSGNNEKNHAYRLAELGIGTNSHALEKKPREWWGSSEGEKKYGTCHIAVGSNGLFGREPDDPNFNSATVHCDMVLGLNPGGEVTIECVKKDDSRFSLIEDGQAVGY